MAGINALRTALHHQGNFVNDAFDVNHYATIFKQIFAEIISHQFILPV